ncbi:MAG: hypothetical protein K9M07_02380 [Simkaniaceae bacterium]|nr:hypothetical protein [Simkaniaceae bacterium]
MKVIDSSKEKVKKICDVLIRETLEPAHKQAEAVIEEAHKEGEKIIEKARLKAKKMIEEAEASIQERQRVFESSLKVSTQQVLTQLRDRIEHHLFHKELDSQIRRYLSNKETVVKIINTVVEALKKDGVSANIEAILSKKFKAEEICADLLSDVIVALKGQTVQVESALEGVMIKCIDQHFSVDITEKAVKELLTMYAQESLRKILFNL